MKKLQSNGFGIVEIIIVVVAIGLLSGGGYYIYKQREKQDSKNTSTDTSQTTQTEDKITTTETEKTTIFATGEEKADYFVQTMKEQKVDSYETSDELYELLVEIDAYGGYHEGLTGKEQKQFATTMGVQIGLYSDFFTKGTVEKVTSSTEENELKLTVTEYQGNNPASKVYTGTYNFTVKTAFIDDAWRIVDFTAEKAQ